MKPKNKIQQRVLELSNALPKITKEQEQDALFRGLDHVAVRLKSGKVTCLDCGHSWIDKEPPLANVVLGADCPGCGCHLKVENTRVKKFKTWSYYTIVTTSKEFQVLRLFQVFGYYFSGKESTRFVHEVSQVWIDPTGKHQIVGYVAGSGYYDDRWFGCWEIRNPLNINKYNIWGYKEWPKWKVIPELKRNGFSQKNTYKLTPHTFFRLLLSNPKFETLIKAKQFQLAVYCKDDYQFEKIEQYWSSIRICLRQNYIVKEPRTYFDYLQLAQTFGKDILSPKFACPVNLNKEHNKYVERRRKIDKAKEIAELRKKMPEQNKVYRSEKKKFFGLCFKEKNIEITPLKNVMEFYNEGDRHRHCLYSNKYFLNKNLLCFSAKVDGFHMETIAFSLSQMTISESRGFKNKPTEHHKAIINVFNKNISEIKKCLKPVPRQKTNFKKQVA